MKQQLKFLLMILCITLADRALFSQDTSQRSSRTVFSHGLPPLDGARLTSHIVEVLYGPGGASPAHSHPCPVVGYIVEGAVRIQIKGQPEATYKAGEGFYEAPNKIHLVSANASNTKPAKLLAFFICDHNKPLSTPVLGDQK
jgi:quercetin dioxygenase-like cupin family protein